MTAAAPAVLDVARSVLGRRWRQRPADDRAAMAIAQRLGVPEIVGRVLAGRGVSPEAAEAFLNPTLRALLPDPSRLADMDKAVERIVAALQSGEKIAVFGDYDVDGATSAALLQRFFAALGQPLRVYIPDRRTEGYGPNAAALRRLAADGIGVVITVDCGIAAFDALAAGAEAGLDVIVVDHHLAEPRLPPAHAVINPNRLDDDSGLGHLAAVGVTFMLVIALNRKLRALRRHGAAGEPDLRQWLDLVALGTVCDIVPLVGLNRALVARGLEVIARRGNVGLAALADVGGVKERPGAYHLGFVLGPRVNAGGRVGEAGLGARLLATGDAAEARALAETLDRLNGERRAIEQTVLDAALDRIAARPSPPGPLVLVAGEGWHPGVIGIVASRLVGRFGRPACVIALDGAAGRGSGRSVRGVDLGAAVIAARQAGHLVNGGGHAMAAGFSVRAQDLDALEAFLGARIAAQADPDALGPSLGVDGVLAPAGATTALLAHLAQAGPYGAGNAEPRFAFADARIAMAERVGDSHVRAVLADPEGRRLKAIAFRSTETALGRALLDSVGRTLHVAGHLRADNWQGRHGVQLFVEDAAHTHGQP